MKWKVRNGTQVNFGGKLYGSGESFTASEELVQAEGLTRYVEQERERKQEAPAKAQQSSPNKAQQSSGNKADEESGRERSERSSK